MHLNAKSTTIHPLFPPSTPVQITTSCSGGGTCAAVKKAKTGEDAALLDAPLLCCGGCCGALVGEFPVSGGAGVMSGQWGLPLTRVVELRNFMEVESSCPAATLGCSGVKQLAWGGGGGGSADLAELAADLRRTSRMFDLDFVVRFF